MGTGAPPHASCWGCVSPPPPPQPPTLVRGLGLLTARAGPEATREVGAQGSRFQEESVWSTFEYFSPVVFKDLFNTELNFLK